MHFLALISLLLALPTFAELLHVSFPSLLVPLVKDHPNQAYGTKPDVTVSHNIHTEVSFDTPQKSAFPGARMCRLNFQINTNPNKNAPKGIEPKDSTRSYSFHASYLEPSIDKDKDTWFDHAPVTGGWPMVTFTIAKDWSVVTDQGWFECPFGNVAQFLLHPTRSVADNFMVGWYELDYPWSQGGPHGITMEIHS